MTIFSDDALFQALNAQRYKEAEQAAQARLASNDDDVQALLVLAVALSSQERWVEALPLYRRLTELQPRQAGHFSNLATILRQSGDLKGAEAMYRRALALHPGDPVLLSNMGLLRWQQGDMVETRELMLAAFQADSGLPEPRIYGALACHACADVDTARHLLVGCEGWPHLGEDFEVDLATALIQIERLEQAETRLKQLMHHYPQSNRARLQLAALYERSNRIAEAEALLDIAGPDIPSSSEELSLRAALLMRSDHPQPARLLYEQILQQGNATAPNAPYYFLLAKCCDRLGDSTATMQALRKGHAAQLESALRLEPELADPVSEPLAVESHRVPEAGRLWGPIEAPDEAASPIFVVGFPRSGTTLLEQMLDAHPDLQSMDEQAFIQDVIETMEKAGYAYPGDLGRIDSATAEQLRKVYWSHVATVVTLDAGQRLVDKNPLNILRLPILMRIFPQARVILMLRHPADVILSCYMQSFRAPAFQILCSTLQRLARGYVSTMQLWFDHIELLHPQVLEIRYEDLLDDPLKHTRLLGDFLGLQDVSPLLRFDEHARAKGYISTPSYTQVVKPLNNKAVDRWQRYHEQLDPLLPILKPIMDHWGYHPE